MMSGEQGFKVDFDGLVTGLAASAVSLMAQVEMLRSGGGADEEEASLAPEQRQKRIADGLAGARQLIDTLAVLEVKTKGNLTEEESGLLQSALSELRIRYVELANRERGGGGGAQESGKGGEGGGSGEK